MKTQTEILQRMEALLNELASNQKPTFDAYMNGPIETTLDVIGRKDMTATQRLIMLYLLFEIDSFPTGEAPQRMIREHVGISNKSVRECLVDLAKNGYVKRGNGAHTWQIC